MVILLLASKFGTTKIECNFEMGKLTPLGVATIYFAIDGIFKNCLFFHDYFIKFKFNYILLQNNFSGNKYYFQ